MKLFNILSMIPVMQSAAVLTNTKDQYGGMTKSLPETMISQNELVVETERPATESTDKPDWMIEFDDYLASDETEFDFETFFSKLNDDEFDDFTFYTIELALEHLKQITA